MRAIWPARRCGKTGAAFGWSYRLRHPYPDSPVIQSGPWKGWRELGYTTEGDAFTYAEDRPGVGLYQALQRSDEERAVMRARLRQVGFNMTRWQQILVEQFEEARRRGSRIYIDLPRGYGRAVMGSAVAKALRGDLQNEALCTCAEMGCTGGCPIHAGWRNL